METSIQESNHEEGNHTAYPPPSSDATNVGERSEVEEESLAKLALKRLQIINEIITTEKAYVEDIEVMLKVYLLPAKSQFPDVAGVHSICNSLEQVLGVNRALLQDLNERASASGTADILVGDIFLKTADYLKMYNQFLRGYVETRENVKAFARNNESFAQFLKEKQALPQCHNLDLPGFLIKPIQRICKYPLLLRELLKCTTKDHPDHATLASAMSKVQSVATHVEDHQQRAENIAKMIEIQHSLNNLGKVKIVEPSRRLIAEGDFQLWTPKRRTNRHMFLFNDFILLSKEKNYKASFYICQTLVSNIGDTPELKDAIELDVITMTDLKKPVKTVYILCAASTAEKKLWLQRLSNCQRELRLLREASRVNRVSYKHGSSPRNFGHLNPALRAGVLSGAASGTPGGPPPAHHVPAPAPASASGVEDVLRRRRGGAMMPTKESDHFLRPSSMANKPVTDLLLPRRLSSLSSDVGEPKTISTVEAMEIPPAVEPSHTEHAPLVMVMGGEGEVEEVGHLAASLVDLDLPFGHPFEAAPHAPTSPSSSHFSLASYHLGLHDDENPFLLSDPIGSSSDEPSPPDIPPLPHQVSTPANSRPMGGSGSGWLEPTMHRRRNKPLEELSSSAQDARVPAPWSERGTKATKAGVSGTPSPSSVPTRMPNPASGQPQGASLLGSNRMAARPRGADDPQAGTGEADRSASENQVGAPYPSHFFA